MDISYSVENDDAVTVRMLREALRSRVYLFLVACLSLSGALMLLACAIAMSRSWPEWFLAVFVTLFPLAIWRKLSSYVRLWLRMIHLQIGSGGKVSFRLTDETYSETCGRRTLASPWSGMGDGYLFTADGLVLFCGRVPTALVPADWSRVDRAGLESVLAAAGLANRRKGNLRIRILEIVSCIVGALMVLMACRTTCRAIQGRRDRLRHQHAWRLLYEALEDVGVKPAYGCIDDRPRMLDAIFAGSLEPDGRLYLVDAADGDGEKEIGLVSRYGERAYWVFLPTACTVTGDRAGFDAELKPYSSGAYPPGDRDRWMERIRPFAKKLYAASMGDD